MRRRIRMVKDINYKFCEHNKIHLTSIGEIVAMNEHNNYLTFFTVAYVRCGL